MTDTSKKIIYDCRKIIKYELIKTKDTNDINIYLSKQKCNFLPFNLTGLPNGTTGIKFWPHFLLLAHLLLPLWYFTAGGNENQNFFPRLTQTNLIKSTRST